MFIVDYPSLWRRCGAVFYDSLLAISVMIIGTTVLLLTTKGQAIPANTLYYQIFLLLLLAAFWIGFWCYGGQTAGMAAWRIKLVTAEYHPVGWLQASLRFCLAIINIACLGIGFLWAIWDSERQTLYDRLTRTKLILLPKK